MPSSETAATMNDLQGQRDEMFVDKNVSACDLPEIVVCNRKELTEDVVKDICVDEGVPMVQEKFLFNKEEPVKESKSSEDNKLEEVVDTKDVMELVVTGDEVGCKKPPPEDCVDTKDVMELVVTKDEVGCEKSPPEECVDTKDVMELLVTGDEVGCEKQPPEDCVDTKGVVELVVTGDEVGSEKSPPEDVVAESESFSNKALTLRDIISMEDDNKPGDNVNTCEAEGNLGREIEQRKTVEKKSVSWRYLPSETLEPENQPVNNVLFEDSYDHHHILTSNFTYEFGARSFSEAAESGLAHITYSGPISISGSLSARSDGSTVSTQSFAFPVMQQEWNSTPARMVTPGRMVNAQKRQFQKEKGWRNYSLLCCKFCKS